jgi:hypothetical protein
MSTPIVFYPHAISSFVYAGAELFQLTNIMDVQPSNNFSDLAEYAASQVGPQFNGSHMAAPDIRFKVHQLQTAMSVVIQGDYYVSRRLDNHMTYCHYKAGQNLGMRVADATTSHLQMLGERNCMFVVEKWGANDGQLAWAQLRLCFVYQPSIGSNPLVATSGVALTAQSLVGNLHTLGPVAVNGTTLRGVTSLVCDNNVTYDEVASSGEGFLTYCSVKNYKPVYTIQTRQADYLATFGGKGTELTSLLGYLRNKVLGGINEPDAALYHISFADNGGSGTVKARQISSEEAQCEITVEPLQPDENEPCYVLAVNQAISL